MPANMLAGVCAAHSPLSLSPDSCTYHASLSMRCIYGTRAHALLTVHLRPLQAGTEALAATGRRLRQLAVVQGVALVLNVTTSSAAVLQQRTRLQAAAGPPYELASNIGSQGAHALHLPRGLGLVQSARV